MKLLAKVVRSNNGTPQFEVKYEDRTYRVKLFKFQENLPDGTPIDCTVTHQANGNIFLRQNLQTLISQFYEIGGEYEFIVRHDFSHNGYYELADHRGISFRLGVPKGAKLLTGSSVRCSLTDIDKTGAHLRLLDSAALFRPNPVKPNIDIADDSEPSEPDSLSELDAASVAAIIRRNLFAEESPEWDMERFFSLPFLNDDFYDLAVSRSLLEIIKDWQVTGAGWEDIARRLHEMLDSIMYLLEGSAVLLDVEPLRRKSLQHRLTVLARNVGGYMTAAEYLARGEHESCVNHVLESLRTSGYVFEAERRLDMMMRIFSLSSDFMQENVKRIFGIIHDRSEDFWRDEPFRKAFIRLIQIYVEQCRQGIEENGSLKDPTVRSLIEALAIQLLLADRETDADVFDYNLNLSTLYRYAGRLRTSVPDNAIRNSFLALMDVTRTLSGIYRWSETDGHDLIASKLTAMPVGLEGSFEKWYANRQVVLKLSDSGVILTRDDVPEDSLRTLDLNGVGIWPNLRVLSPQRIIAPSGETNLKRSRDMWSAIESSLFSEDEEVKRPNRIRRPLPAEDDYCMIRVTRRIDDNLFAVVVTDDYYEGHGVIALDDIVRYKVPGLTPADFADQDGNPYIFEARVKRVDDGVIHFTASDAIVKFTHDQMVNDNELICVIKSSNQYGTVGVSELGDAVRFQKSGLSSSLRNGTIVKASYWTRPDNPSVPYIDGVVTEIVEEPMNFRTDIAFNRLIADYSNGNIYEMPADNLTISGDEPNSEDLVSDARMKELMALVESKAAAESNYSRAYNHLGFARLLARMARDDNRREFYAAWMRLIEILHYFAMNGIIDAEQLEEFEANDRSRFDHRSEIYHRYLQLKIVSYKGKPQMRDALWAYMSDSDEEIRNLASYVMAYNILAENSSASALGEIEDRINYILHVNARKSTLHSFGKEDKTTEFKTSLIYPPNNHMRPDPDTQSRDVMKELCSLLNADGGTLYIGVNDFGMGVGMENDLAYKMFDGSEDKYDLYFRRAVCTTMGRDVDAYVETRFETFGGKRIYVATAKPYYTAPVKVDGVIYERHGSSKLDFRNPEDIRRFIDRRAEERERHRLLQAAAATPSAETSAPTQSAAAAAAPATDATSQAPAETAATTTQQSSPDPQKSEKSRNTQAPTTPSAENPEKIATRHWRAVCPASFDPDHDPSTTRYLQILKDGFMMTSDFYGYTDPDLLLALPIRDEDARSWVVLGYEDGTVCRVPMKLFLDKEDFKTGRRYEDSNLIFADILTDDEALLTLSEGSRGSWNARADHPENLTEVAGIRNAGSRLFNTEQAHYTFDVISGAKVLNYQDLFNRTAKDCGRLFNRFKGDKLFKQLLTDGYVTE